MSMGMIKRGSGQVIPETTDHVANTQTLKGSDWTQEDQDALDAENAQADEDEQ